LNNRGEKYEKGKRGETIETVTRLRNLESVKRIHFIQDLPMDKLIKTIKKHLFYKKKIVLVCKGNFNPIHDNHVTIMDAARTPL